MIGLPRKPHKCKIDLETRLSSSCSIPNVCNVGEGQRGQDLCIRGYDLKQDWFPMGDGVHARVNLNFDMSLNILFVLY